MDLELSDDQVALRDELRRLLVARCTSEVRRAAMALPGAVDRGLWAELADMGTFSLTRSEASGGAGLGLADAAIVFEELGRALVPGPTIATFLAAGLTDGAVVGLVDRSEPAMVEHLDGLDALLVLDADDGVGLVEPPAGLAPVDRPLDPLTPVTIVASLPAGARVGDAGVAERIRRDGALLAAASQIGIGQGALELAVDYAKSRTQFGRPIGSFQALKHLLADAAVAVEIGRAAVHAAAVALDEGSDAGVAAARVLASSAAVTAASTCVQVHGGMGYTWDVDAHLFLKRALVLDQSFTTPDDAVAQIAARL